MTPKTSRKRAHPTVGTPNKRVRRTADALPKTTKEKGSNATAAKRTGATGVVGPSTSISAPPAPLNHPPTTVLDVFVFGNGEAGELGLGPDVTEAVRPRLNPFLSAPSPSATTATDTPVPFDVVQIACGGMHSVALTRNNEIMTWGVNDNGALGRDTAWEGGLKEVKDQDGDGDGSDSGDDDDASLNPRESTPTALPAGAFPPDTVFVQVAAGDSCSFALTATGLVYGWGAFRTPEGEEVFFRDPATGTLVTRQPTPVRIPGLAGITQIAAGANHALALEGRAEGGGGEEEEEGKNSRTAGARSRRRKRSTRLWAWGCGDQNQLGCRLLPRRCPHDAKGRVLLAAATPHVVEVGGGSGASHSEIRFIACGEYHAFAVDTRDRVWAWGLNSFGETGAAPYELQKWGANAASTVVHPTQVVALAGRQVIALAGGGHHSVAITADGRCLVWGRLDGGQLGVDPGAVVQTADNPPLVLTDDRGRPRICLRPVDVRLGGGAASKGQEEEEKALRVACGTEHTLIVTSAASHAAWGAGFNAQAQLGLGRDADDEVAVVTRLGGKALQDRRLTWAGAGGQFSIVAGPRISKQ